ncbi:uncharacterized protein LOC126455776 [Schistocerca serialis cubense]|uniref:uncharacterized protein LOC126455776 n=1 Tax=Schistocerca serialis cubense TaxID=2023355 RepID=UPI00214F1563|nr:uncharacterized protein LOC126455776 [Schistocerca serialis cubense]
MPLMEHGVVRMKIGDSSNQGHVDKVSLWLSLCEFSVGLREKALFFYHFISCSWYQNSGLQMQFPSLVQSSAYREDAGVNARTLLFEDPAAYQYGRHQLSSDEDPVSEAHFQTQMPLMGQHSLYGRLPSYGQHTLRNPYRDEFSDIAREPAYHVHREPIGVLRCRSYSGQYAYPLPQRNPERAHRRSFLDMRPHIYRRTAYPEQPFYGYVDGGNMFFMNRY